MIDWLTVELPDPVGIPVNAGQIMRVSRHGELEWTTPARLAVEGSWSSNMTFRAVGASYHDDCGALVGTGLNYRDSGLEVSGNPAKFLNGHNLFGSADCAGLLSAVISKGRDAIWPDLFGDLAIDCSEGLISRIDLTGSWLLDREADVLPYLRAMEESVWCPYRGRGVFDAGGSTLYYGRTAKGKRAKDWALKLYWKGPEVTVHPLPQPAYAVPGLLEEVNRTIRVELTLRTAELKRLGLRKVGDWTPAKVREIWEAYVMKLDFGEATVNLDTADLGSLGLKARHVHALSAWKAGNDLRAGMSRTAFYRLRRELKDATGFDIALARPRSNVVPLRRVVAATPARYPDWADHLTEALARAA
jgi:II/X family phage/plasmid replication protein